jgi:transmembrane sensor
MIDVQRAISWRNGQLIFQNDPLAEAVAEFNRYGGRRIVLAGADLADLPISGAFRTGNTAGFIATVSSYFGLHVAERTEDRIVLARRG